jgi:RNA 2',3'-cyclic 3'-phosphodiesterase
MADRHRIFVAVPLAPALRRAAAAVRGEVGPVAAELRWVPEENLHLTLRFLGHVTADEAGRAGDAAREAAGGAAPFRIALGGVGAFPSLRASRVVWVGVADDTGGLAALAAALEAQLVARGFPPADRPFRAHLTVARARAEDRGVDLRRLPSRVTGPEAPVVGGQRVDAVSVVESTLGKGAPVYRETFRASLTGG